MIKIAYISEDLMLIFETDAPRELHENNTLKLSFAGEAKDTPQIIFKKNGKFITANNVQLVRVRMQRSRADSGMILASPANFGRADAIATWTALGELEEFK